MSCIRPSDDILKEPFWDGLARGHLLLQRCKSCRAFQHPPLPICGKCRSFDLQFEPVKGDAVLLTYTVIHHPVHPILAEKVPYTVGLVQLAEGPLLVAPLQIHNRQVQCGMALKCRVDRIDERFCFPVFE